MFFLVVFVWVLFVCLFAFKIVLPRTAGSTIQLLFATIYNKQIQSNMTKLNTLHYNISVKCHFAMQNYNQLLLS